MYEVKFYNRQSNRWVENTSLRITAKHGANISDKWPTYNGSSTWSTTGSYDYWNGLSGPYQVNIQTMPLGGASFYGPKTGSGSETAYYYVEVLPGESGGQTYNGVSYKLHHKDTSPGTGYTVTKEDKYPITGFTYKEGTRNGSDYDNARFYYTRNSYQIKFINGGSVDKTESRKFQQSIADAEYTPTAPAGKEGYIFAGWYDNEQGEGEQFAFAGKTMPAQNITLYAKWVAPVHTVTFYQEDKVTVVKAVAGIPHGTAMENGDIPAYTPAEGYAFLGWVMEDGSPFNPSMLITRDYHIYARVGSLNAYTVTYDANGGTGDVPVDDGRYAEGAAARVLSGAGLTGPADKPQFLGWALSAEASAPDYYPGSQLILGRENVTLYAVWGVKENTVSLTYHSNFGTDATYTVEALAVNGRVEVLSYDTTGLPARQGYNFLGWSTSASGSVSFAPGSSLRVNAGGSNDLYAVWEPAADTPYRVETYYQQLDGSYLDDPHHAEIRKGTTGTPVSVTEKDKLSRSTAYVFDEGYAGNVLSGVVAADGSLKLKLYFKLNTAPYTIHHYLKGTTVQVAADQTGRLVIGSTLTANAAADLYAEYAAATVNVYDPGRRITITAGNNEIIVYYTLPLTLTAGSAEKVYDGAPLTQPAFTAEGLVNGDTAEKISLSMTAESTITNVGSVSNVIDRTTVQYDGGALPAYYTLTLQPGTLTVTRRGAGEKKVKIIANSYTVEYDGRFHGANGYTTEYLAPGHKVKKLILAGGRTDAGEYPGEFVPYDAAIVDANGNDVTHNYVITFVAGDLTITKRGLDPKNPVIVRADNSEVEYDGQPHGYVGHTASNLAEGHSVQSVESSFTATEAGYHETMIDVSDAVIVDAKGNDVTRNYAITYIFGDLRITKRGAGERKVLIIARDNTVEYDGQPHGQNGIDTDYLAPGHRVADVTIDGEKINAGRYAALLYPYDAVIVDAEGNDVTHNYKLTYVKGTLEITPYAGEVVVTITGNHDRVHYDGEEHTVSGYTVDIDTALYTEADFRFKGTASVTKVYPGTYAMGLQEKDFVNLNENLANVKFVVTDGYLEIYTKKFMVAWMYDTNQMVNGSQPSEAFTAMTDYIHRKDVSLVLHTGNMVENAADAGQWKVFNDAMQKLYDDAGKDVLMVAGEKEAAAGSLFLQQPVREGFDEKDLFEGGKGFVYRFRIGDKRMILVGLGEDAMTEEGLKWAKERFDSDKKAVGILMVHTYLLADMTQKQKIADSALKLEENVVKPCSNVRLVLSSNAGYASHHYFYYGMRKTTAINMDIEAAAKEGYFTMLTFDKDFHYVAVNSLSPYRNDYIYNDEKAELERYHLGELY